MEALIYQIRPWAFASLGVYAIVTSQQSSLLFFSGATLAAAAGLIIYARSEYRRRF